MTRAPDPPASPPPVAFADLYRREVAGVYRYCLARLHRREDAEDATEEVFVKALAAWPRLRSAAGAHLVPWLYRIAVNVVRDVQRSARRRPVAALPEDHPDPREGAEARALRRVEAAEVRAAVDRLPPVLRATVALRFAAGLDARAVGAVLGKTPGAVRTDLWRALRLLRPMLQPLEEEEPCPRR